VLTSALAALVLTVIGLVATAPSASAADRGVGFGTWAPLSAHGWHGSMVVGGVHTYCILPGLPAPTGASTDHGVRSDAGGLSPVQLAGINRLVSTYGQTDDPVQAAAVGWAVKAIAHRDTALHSWGYGGDSLAEAVRWSLDRLVPEHAGAVAELAERYYAEGSATTVPETDATLRLMTDESDPRRGTVRLDGGAGTEATLTLTHAVFADTGEAVREGAPRGEDLAIRATPPEDATPFRVGASARLTAAFAPAVRYVTTAGQQDTAGPGGGVEYTVETTDETPRPVVFSPGISTQVAAAEATSGPFIDDVTIAPVDGVWPRTDEGSLVALRASATVYRTEQQPEPTAEIPDDAEAVGELELVTDPELGGGTYRVTSEWELPGPGVYTAVWRIVAAEQEPEVARHLERDYVWAEEFGTPSQVVRVPVPPAPPASEAPPAVDEAPVLAVTGADESTPRVAGAGLAVLLLGGALLAQLSQRTRGRRRETADPGPTA
jgi:hypothetical protein